MKCRLRRRESHYFGKKEVVSQAKMLKKDQCWRCDTICLPPSPKISCSGCGIAIYCNEVCKHDDIFRHRVDCETATLKRKCAGCGKEKTGLKPCGSCRKQWYCDKECQRNSWPTHKTECQAITAKTEELSRQLKLVYDFKKSTTGPGLGTVYYWGNLPAVDLINLPLNEGVQYNKPLSILVCGVGDPRNVVLSLSQLPDSYKEELNFVLNDICPCVMARTVLLLYMLVKGREQIANSVTQIWYSLRLSDEDFTLVMRTLQELIHASSLEELTRGTMKLEQDHLHTLMQVWRTWLHLGSREGDWITEERRRMFEKDRGSKDGMELYLNEIPKEHKASASDWFANGILLPKGSRKYLTRENVTLTGIPATQFLNRNDGPHPFSYILDPSVIPFISWDYKDVKQHFHCASLLKMYSQCVGYLLERCVATLASGKVKFHFLLSNCMEMTPFLPADREYDRITTSNIADYVPLTNILDMCKPLLNKANPSSVIVTEFRNWSAHLKLTQKELLHHLLMTKSFRQQVLQDTKNPAIANSYGMETFVEYHDYSAEFTRFVRAALLVTDREIPEKANRRTWRSVADYNGLVARDFLRCQNRVFPAKWMQNCRRVTMMTGFERAVEWIVSPQ